MAVNRAAIILMIFLSLIYKSSSIRCYYCNSANNSACVDFSQYSDELLARVIPVVECSSGGAVPSHVNVDFFCRKIVQTIFRSHHDSEVRVTRGCGWIPHDKECYHANNADHLETVCQCFNDHCNSGGKTRASAVIALATVALMVMF